MRHVGRDGGDSSPAADCTHGRLSAACVVKRSSGQRPCLNLTLKGHLKSEQCLTTVRRWTPDPGLVFCETLNSSEQQMSSDCFFLFDPISFAHVLPLCHV